LWRFVKPYHNNKVCQEGEEEKKVLAPFVEEDKRLKWREELSQPL
jgi:hypothetical protein